MRLKLLIDADPICYRACQTAEEELEFSSDLTLIVGDYKRAQHIVRHELKKLTDRFETNDFILYFTGTKNFRKVVDPSYKGNRIRRKPAGYLKLKLWMMDQYESECEDTLEADDLLGIAATSGKYQRTVVCSPDKDLKQIPGRLFNGTDEFTVTPEEGEFQLWMQALCGDATDGYKGVPGIGAKKAAALLSDSTNYWNTVAAAYEMADLTVDDAIRTVRLAQILTAPQWDGKDIKLFTP